MRTIKNIRTRSEKFHDQIALTIGNFDGCHLGHQRLIASCKEAADRLNIKSAVMTFDPAPEQFFKGEAGNSPRLFTIDQKLQALGELGIDVAIVESFDEAMAKMPHQEFFELLIVNKLNTQDLTIGYDFKFGNERRGNADYLVQACDKKGIGFSENKSFLHNGQPVSSTKIRQAIVRGSVEEAATMLGRPYSLRGNVVQGDQKGRDLGFPTANLSSSTQVIPRLGVYCGWASFEEGAAITTLPEKKFPVVINIGIRPTVTETRQLRIEAHCFNTEFGKDELYTKPMTLYVTNRLRDEKKFTGLEDLKASIKHDIEQATQTLPL